MIKKKHDDAFDREDDKRFLDEITEPKYKIKEVTFYKPGKAAGPRGAERITVSKSYLSVSGEFAGSLLGKKYKVGAGIYNDQKVIVMAEAEQGGVTVSRARPNSKSVKLGGKALMEYLESQGIKIGRHKVLKFKDCIIGVPMK